MTVTVAANFVFVPKVWSDHISAYFVRKLVFGAFAFSDDTLTKAPGGSVIFPFFNKIGAAETPGELDDLTVDSMSDDSFTATVKEVGKAVGFTDKSLRVAAPKQEIIFNEAQNQIGQVIAERIDADLITEMNDTGNFYNGFTATLATDVCTVGNILTAKTLGFGDRSNEAVAIFMHSLHYLSMLKDTNTGMIRADANDPMYLVPGFMGRLFGAAVVVTDNVPAGPTVGGKKTYYAYIIKRNAYGFMTAEDLNFEKDRDILARQTIITATQWYAVKAFHAKHSTDDRRIVRALFATEVNA